jgi:DNA-binding response OmpR family regulator
VAKCVLVVEDEALLRRTLTTALAEAGFRTIAVGSAEEAEPHLFPRAAADLVVLDNRLPKGSGVAVLQRLRESRAGCSVLLMTAYDQAEVRGAASRWADGYLLKPFDLQHVVEAVTRLLELPSPAGNGKPGKPVRGPRGVARRVPERERKGGDPRMAKRRKKAAKKGGRKKAAKKKK